MSTRALDRSGAAIVAILGIGLLAARLPLLTLPPSARVTAMVLLLAGIGAASWLTPVPRTSVRRMPPAAVLAIGIAAVLLASGAVGRPPGLPTSTWTVPLALFAAVAEELLFRRVAYAAIARRSELLAVALTAVAFALIHLPLYGVAALPVDLGAGTLFSWQRWAAGSWSVPAATHAVANLLAVIR
jgi:membrane protease YdiL (CAAX protease family)